jgi:DNA-binding MarR family transcriptional regulator
MATQTGADSEAGQLAVALALATKRLAGRFRERIGEASGGISLSQLAILGRVRRDGPLTAAALAAAEHVSGQAIAQALPGLKAAGLITAQAHPTDGRKTLIAATDDAETLWRAMLDSRDAWLARVLETELTARERATLADAVSLIERIADASG